MHRPPRILRIYQSPANINLQGVEDRCMHTLSTEEFARDVEGFTSHNDNLLTVQKLLCDGAGEATKEMSLAVNDDL